MKVLMIGATGHYASLLLPELTRRGATVRALIRDESKVAEANLSICEVARPDENGEGVLRKILRDLKPDAFVSPSEQGDTFVLHVILLQDGRLVPCYSRISRNTVPDNRRNGVPLARFCP
jgi:uncharacterized protein YbjT (DUF2867 family)